MRNVLYVSLCWAMTLGLVAVALGQQQATNPFADSPASSAQSADGTHSLLTQRSTVEPAALEVPRPRGELGVWMGDSGGPGVKIMRVNSGSAASQAGLRVGDVILQVNGQGATSPQETAKLIKDIGLGGVGSLTIWRDGNQQQLQVTLMPVREGIKETPRPVRRESTASSGDLASRTGRLEQQVASLTQEMAALRQDIVSFRANGPVQTDYRVETGQIPAPQDSARGQAVESQAQAPVGSGSDNPLFTPTEEAPAKPAAADAPKPTPPAPKPVAEAPKPAAAPATPPAPAPAPAAEKSEDLFGAAPASPAPATPAPAPAEKPKAEEKKADEAEADDLFK